MSQLPAPTITGFESYERRAQLGTCGFLSGHFLVSELIRCSQKPTRKYHEAVFLMQRFLDIMTGLRKVRENVPREEAIVNVLSERRDLVSPILRTRLPCHRHLRVDIVRLHRLVRL